MTFSNIKQIVVPEGAVKKITYNGATLWERISRYLKTVIGKVVTVTDALNEPAESLVVTFNPKQDLNGYDKPWAGGSGKNLLDISELFAAPEDILYSGDTPYTFPHVLELALTPNTTYTVSSNYAIANKQRIVYVDTATSADAVYKVNPVVKTTGDDGILKIGFFDNRTGSEEFLNKTVYLQVEEGSTATGYEPYENVCPISGHTECVTKVCGKNLLNPTLYSGGQYNPSVGTRWTLTESAQQFENPSEGVFTLLCPTIWMQRVLVFEMPDDEADYYLRLARSSTGDCGTTLGWLDADYTVLTVGNYTNASYEHSFALANRPSGAKYYYITLTNRGTANAILTVTNPQIELGSTATSYEPYQGTSYTTTLGRTVYGGTLDVVSGELVVDRVMVDLGTQTWYRYDPSVTNIPVFYASVPNAKIATIPICSAYKCESWSSLSSRTNGTLQMHPTLALAYVADDRFTDATDFKTAVSGVQLVYELATPQTYQLTPQQINMFKYNNNFMANENDISLTYWGTEQSN